MTRVVSAYTSGLISIKPTIQRERPKITVVAHYVNHGMNSVLSENIFNNRQLCKIIPDLKSIGVRIAYKRDPPLSRIICNHTTFLRKLNAESIKTFLQNKCECDSSPYKYLPHNHIITGDLNIIDDCELRKIMRYGAKYRIPVNMDWVAVRTQCTEIINQFLRKYKGQYRDNLVLFIEKAYSIIDNRIRWHQNNEQRTKPTINYEHKIRKLQKTFIIVPADKAANNLVVLCPKHYVMDMCQEMGVSINVQGLLEFKGNSVYKPT